MPPGSIALVVVSIADGQAIQGISLLAKKLGRLVVVTLEGFDEPEPAAGFFSALQQTGCYLVRCRQGKLEDAFVALQQMEERAAAGPAYTSGSFRVRSTGPAWELEAATAKSLDSDPSGPLDGGPGSINSPEGQT